MQAFALKTGSRRRVTTSMAELYKEFRPNGFADVVGQDSAIKVLTDFGKQKRMPHSIMFTGPSGCGKTTLARIVRQKLKCADIDFFELNCADFRGIDLVREIRSRINAAPLQGPCRIYLIDEMHQMTSQAQDALLKLLEDTPKHVYFFLCTTDPGKLKTAIKTRCTEIKVSLLDAKKMRIVLDGVAKKIDKPLDDEVADKIIKLSDGSPRKALVLLDSVIGMGNPEEQLSSLEANDSEAEGIEICRLLLRKNVKWGDVAPKLKQYKGEVEQLRWMILSYFKNVLLSGKDTDLCYRVICAFRDPFYDSKDAGLCAACYEVVVGE